MGKTPVTRQLLYTEQVSTCCKRNRAFFGVGMHYRDRKLIDKPLRGVKKQVIERRIVEYLA